MNLRMTPVDLDRNGQPTDERLFAAVQVYSEQQFGAPLNPAFYQKLWAVEAWDAERLEYQEVMGVTGLRMIPDCPTFHVTPPTRDKEGIRLQHFARDMMVMRILNYCSDLGQRGSYGTVYVSPDQQKRWGDFLKRTGFTPANRFQVTFP